MTALLFTHAMFLICGDLLLFVFEDECWREECFELQQHDQSRLIGRADTRHAVRWEHRCPCRHFSKQVTHTHTHMNIRLCQVAMSGRAILLSYLPLPPSSPHLSMTEARERRRRQSSGASGDMARQLEQLRRRASNEAGHEDAQQ